MRIHCQSKTPQDLKISTSEAQVEKLVGLRGLEPRTCGL
jgi:hypothetical protein